MFKNRKMGRPSQLHEPVTKPHIFERSRLAEFRQWCQDNDISESEGLRQLIEEKLEKNESGELNPLKIPYEQQQQQHHFEQMDLRLWLPRKQAIEMAKKLNLNANEWQHLSQTCAIISHKVKTGYL